jgi:hypothetical protein
MWHIFRAISQVNGRPVVYDLPWRVLMSTPWDGLPHIQNFLRLDFLFSGLEVSPEFLFAARALVFVVLATGIVVALLKIVLKALDCVQAFLAGLSRLPRAFFLVLLFVIPLLPDSLGAKWAGYILMLVLLFGLALTGLLAVVLWKYGVDQTLRLIDYLRRRSTSGSPGTAESTSPPDGITGEMSGPFPGGPHRAGVAQSAG